jgi:hypothetical protein
VAHYRRDGEVKNVPAWKGNQHPYVIERGRHPDAELVGLQASFCGWIYHDSGTARPVGRRYLGLGDLYQEVMP